jgi:hypothetical protein
MNHLIKEGDTVIVESDTNKLTKALVLHKFERHASQMAVDSLEKVVNIVGKTVKVSYIYKYGDIRVTDPNNCRYIIIPQSFVKEVIKQKETNE